MLEYIGVGSALAFAAAVQPGPLQAYMFSRAAAVGWQRTLPAAAAPLVTDGPIALVALVLLGQLTPFVQGALRLAGAALLLVFAWRALAAWRRPATAPSTTAGPRTLAEAALVNALNPNPYLGWALILGPVVMGAWNDEPRFGIAVVASFYATIVAVSALLILAFGSARLFGPRLQRGLLLVSALVLGAMAAYQTATGLDQIRSG